MPIFNCIIPIQASLTSNTFLGSENISNNNNAFDYIFVSPPENSVLDIRLFTECFYFTADDDTGIIWTLNEEKFGKLINGLNLSITENMWKINTSRCFPNTTPEQYPDINHTIAYAYLSFLGSVIFKTPTSVAFFGPANDVTSQFAKGLATAITTTDGEQVVRYYTFGEQCANAIINNNIIDTIANRSTSNCPVLQALFEQMEDAYPDRLTTIINGIVTPVNFIPFQDGDTININLSLTSTLGVQNQFLTTSVSGSNGTSNYTYTTSLMGDILTKLNPPNASDHFNAYTQTSPSVFVKPKIISLTQTLTSINSLDSTSPQYSLQNTTSKSLTILKNTKTVTTSSTSSYIGTTPLGSVPTTGINDSGVYSNASGGLVNSAVNVYSFTRNNRAQSLKILSLFTYVQNMLKLLRAVAVALQNTNLKDFIDINPGSSGSSLFSSFNPLLIAAPVEEFIQNIIGLIPILINPNILDVDKFFSIVKILCYFIIDLNKLINSILDPAHNNIIVSSGDSQSDTDAQAAILLADLNKPDIVPKNVQVYLDILKLLAVIAKEIVGYNNLSSEGYSYGCPNPVKLFDDIKNIKTDLETMFTNPDPLKILFGFLTFVIDGCDFILVIIQGGNWNPLEYIESLIVDGLADLSKEILNSNLVTSFENDALQVKGFFTASQGVSSLFISETSQIIGVLQGLSPETLINIKNYLGGAPIGNTTIGALIDDTGNFFENIDDLLAGAIDQVTGSLIRGILHI